MTLDELKSRIRTNDLETFVDEVVLSENSPHFADHQIHRILGTLAAKFSVEKQSIRIRVVGSAKLGFGLFEKKSKTGEFLPAFRSFRPESDIDLAVISSRIYQLIWDELSTHAYNSSKMPWDSGKLGDYMVHGWLRPDYFPKNVRLRRCDDWRDTFRSLSADRKLGRRPIRGALYHSYEHLRMYQLRGLSQCRAKLEIQE
jgi:hypothetical protein